MTPAARDALLAAVSALCDRHGPWAVLWAVARVLRPAFRAMQSEGKL